MSREKGDTTTARGWLEQSLSIYRDLDDKLGISWTTVTLGEVLNMQGDLITAKIMIEEGLILARQHKEPQAVGWAQSHLGYNALLRGDFEDAKNNYTESAAVFESVGPHKAGLGWAYLGLGEVGLATKDASSAISNLKVAVKFFSAYKNQLGIAWCLESLAAAISLNNQYEQAAKFWSMADAMHDLKGVRSAPIITSLHEKRRAKVRSKLGESKFEALWTEKRSVSFEQAVSEAMAL
jgi:tetratricopeptide (TPR) repeat protein